ncbi:hypothetical protein [Streptomyces sp. NBC_01643]|uniref:hypothetical protein n=1 Tax=Streptomyces sp. NBC_01643 TaxID=2975906 RepID=UPI0038691262|nr:hypothetical protein OHB03_18175 [Streptomyces sp. NBC_01643]
MDKQQPQVAEDHTFHLSDRLDVPVLLRGGPERRPSRKQWEGAERPWPGVVGVPENGWYLATTTWRQIVKAATEVGRDIEPWLALTPNLAISELVSRISPLHAYLCLRKVKAPAPTAAGRRLFVNAVYRHGTERSAQSAFGYHFGMTMAQWMCAGMMGLGPTQHIETGGPNGDPGFLQASTPLPDLWGTHPAGPLHWLVEAKARQLIGLGDLREGLEQLQGGSALMHGQRHLQVLCGTSMPAPQKWEQDHVFMSVDAMNVAGPPVWPGRANPSPVDPSGSGSEAHLLEDNDALLLTVQSQMLVYRALAHGVVDDLRIVPLSSARGERHRSSAGSLSCIEEDEETQVVRQRLDDDPPATEQHMRGRRGVADFIAGRIPGTGTHVGMSRRLFAACRNLDVLQVQAAREAEVSVVPLPIESDVVWDDEAVNAATRAEQMVYREGQQPRERHRTVREGFERSDSMSWRMLLGDREPVVNWRRRGLLEGATAETYIAIETSDPVLRSSRD